MWILDNKRIFVSDWKAVGNQIIPRLQPLAGGTVLQVFGYESYIHHITGLVVGLSDKNAILAMTQDGVNHTLSGPYGVIGDFLIKSAQASMLPTECQTIRQDLDQFSPVFSMDVELQKE